MIRKTECPISRDQFRSEAKGLEVVVNGQTVPVPVKEFSTGSFGWFHGDKLTLQVGDKLVKVQVGLTFTVIGSKDLPRETALAPQEGAKEAA